MASRSYSLQGQSLAQLRQLASTLPMTVLTSSQPYYGQITLDFTTPANEVEIRRAIRMLPHHGLMLRTLHTGPSTTNPLIQR